ncbi:site-specific integrase [Mesorhizobium sp.]|uniref:site-specific integrase n=1 Tax=Mesorhizobium sp. TaxID=1871066 RepID=UPI0025C3BF16|nr:site-specific integrase [Mesorhizobium sp.]
MTEERTTPLRERMIEDMRIRGMGDKAQQAHIRAIKDFARFLKRSPDTATPDDLRAYQLHMTNAGVTPTTFNARIVSLRFFFGITCGREDMKASRHESDESGNRPHLREGCGKRLTTTRPPWST